MLACGDSDGRILNPIQLSCVFYGVRESIHYPPRTKGLSALIQQSYLEVFEIKINGSI